MRRRQFLSAATAVVWGTRVSAAAHSAGRRVAVIGHTGRGNYGHGLDTVWQQIPGTEIVGVADPVAAGLKLELRKLGLESGGYADYREMLQERRPEFVSVCPRHADQHCDMILAAIEAGAGGIYVEKPFVRTPEEGDRVIAACSKHGACIAVAHRNAWHPVMKIIREMMTDGTLGRVHEIRGRGKGDRRGGGEDLWVLGTHVMNLLHYFGGAPVSCSARMLQNGRPVTAADVKDGNEGLGPLAADEIHARYELADGITATFDTVANDGFENAGFGLQLIGTKGIVNIQVDRDPVAHFVPGNPFAPTTEPRPWIPITTAGVGKPESHPELVAQVHNHVVAVQDLIDASDGKREPACDARAGLITVEMVTAVFESHRQNGQTIPFPLTERGNALSAL